MAGRGRRTLLTASIAVAGIGAASACRTEAQIVVCEARPVSSPVVTTAATTTTAPTVPTSEPSTTVAVITPTSSTTTTAVPTTAAATTLAAPVAPPVQDLAPPDPALERPQEPAPTTVASNYLPIPPVVPAASAGRFAEFDRVIGDATLGQGALTVGIAVAHDGVVLHESAYGLANAITGEPPTPTSRFRVASISKVFAAITVMQLVEQGVVSMDETPLASFGLPLGDPLMATVTVRQLLSHTSGLPQAPSLYFDRGAESWQDAVAVALAGPLDTPPGSKYRYSNTNYAILGALIEQRTGQPYDQAIHARVFAPLGLSGQRVAGTFDTQAGDVWHPSTAGRNYMETLGASGTWIASAGDSLRVLLSLDPTTMLPHPVDGASVAQMQTQLPGTSPTAKVGYGLGLRLWPDGTWGHTGTLEHAKGIVIKRPDGWAVAVLINGEVPAQTDSLPAIINAALLAMA